MLRRAGIWVREDFARVRRGGRDAILWSARITIAATASYLAGLAIFPGTQPLLAPLTAMLVVQVTPVSLLASGRDRVLSVVAGVALAVGFSEVVPLEWWSLGLLILVAITVGQYLRLRDNLMEVAISAMLVLGVGALGTSAAAWQRIAETLVGAAVGILVNLVFPPKVASSQAAHAIDGLADRLTDLLVRSADELGDPGADEVRHRDRAWDWLTRARRITHDIPDVGAALLRAEEGRRLNVRAVRTPPVEAGLRQGLEALEHTSVAVRSLMRAVADAADDGHLDGPDGAAVREEVATTFRQLALGIDAFGELVRNEGDVQVELSASDVDRLRQALADLDQAEARVEDRLAAGGDVGLQELRTYERSTIRRILDELDLATRARRQVQLVRPRSRLPRPPRRRRRDDLWAPAGPEDETQVLPRIPGDADPPPDRA